MISKKCSIALIVSGVVLIAIGIVVFKLPDLVLPGIKQSSFPIIPSSETYEPWKTPTLPVTMKFWFFNVTNYKGSDASETSPEEGGNPVVDEIGPYVYREQRVRENIRFNKDLTELSYTDRAFFYFDEAASMGLKEDDIIYGVDMPMLTVLGMLKSVKSDKVTPEVVEAMFGGMIDFAKIKVIDQRQVRELIWGTEYPVLKQVKNLIATLVGAKMLPKEDADKLKKKLSSTEFGYLINRNGSSVNAEVTNYTMGTGKNDLNDVAKIKVYDGMTKLDYWGSDYANQIEGTDGSMFHPGVDADETLFMFSGDICRSIYAKNTGTEVVKGVSTMVFSPPPEVFASHEKNPKNEAFCRPKPCPPSGGMMKLNKCRQDAPVLVSQPHLQGADEDVVNSITGIFPDKNKHVTKLYVEPNTGVLAEARKRLQFNALIEPLAKVKVIKDMRKDSIIPLFWLEEGFTVDDEFASMLNSNVFKLTFLPKYGPFIMAAFIVIGVILIVYATYSLGRNHHKNDNFYIEPLTAPVRMSSLTRKEDIDYAHVNNGYCDEKNTNRR